MYQSLKETAPQYLPSKRTFKQMHLRNLCPFWLCSAMREKDFKIQMFGLAWLLWLNRLNKQETYAAKEDREMSREINEAHSTEVTLQKQNGERGERGRDCAEVEHSNVNLLTVFQYYKSVADICFPACGERVHKQHHAGCSHRNNLWHVNSWMNIHLAVQYIIWYVYGL